MQKLIVITTAFLFLCFGKIAAGQTVPTVAKVIKFDALERMMTANSDTTYIFNFFATWCEPCVKELPDFQKYAASHTGDRTKVIFISLDFKKALKTALNPFLKKRSVTNEVYLLDEPDYNTWIDRVDSSWEGNLPATFVINNSKHIRRIFPRDFTYESLAAAIASLKP